MLPEEEIYFVESNMLQQFALQKLEFWSKIVPKKLYLGIKRVQRQLTQFFWKTRDGSMW